MGALPDFSSCGAYGVRPDGCHSGACTSGQSKHGGRHTSYHRMPSNLYSKLHISSLCLSGPLGPRNVF